MPQHEKEGKVWEITLELWEFQGSFAVPFSQALHFNIHMYYLQYHQL